jgi:hypothetical protein
MDSDEACQQASLVFAREEDRVVDVAEGLDPAVGRGRDGNDGFVGDRYDASSSPRTSS